MEYCIPRERRRKAGGGAELPAVAAVVTRASSILISTSTFRGIKHTDAVKQKVKF